MNWRQIGVVYGKELRDTLRDRRAVVSMFVLPTVLIPVIVLAFVGVATRTATKAREETPRVMVLGAENSPKIKAALAANARIKLVSPAANYEQLIADKQLRAAVRLPADFDAMLEAGETAAVTVFHYQGEMRSRFGANELETFFRDYRDKALQARLAERNLPANLLKPFEVTRENVAPPERVGGSIIGGMIPYVFILLCFTGAMYPALDLTAGEKERGTMETILCSPVGRTELVLGKFLMVLTGSLSTVALAMATSAITFPLGAMLVRSAGGASAAGAAQASSPLAIDPVGVLASFGLVLPVAVLFAAVMFTLALFAKSYKEAQSTVSPLIVVVILPAMGAMLPGVELNAKLALVPLLNVALASKELVSGVFHWGYLALIFGSTCVYAAAALGLAVRMFRRESVMFRA